MKKTKEHLPRTNTRKVVCSECGANINSDNKIIHSTRRHLGKKVKFQPHLESGQQILDFFGGSLNTTVEDNNNTSKADVKQLRFQVSPI